MDSKRRARTRLLDIQRAFRLAEALDPVDKTFDFFHGYGPSSLMEVDKIATIQTCEYTYTSPERIRALSSMPINKAPVVLFTPTLHPAMNEDTMLFAEEPPDPFEVFGRALSKHYPWICHVPYDVDVGFTRYHTWWVEQAGAVITVVCEPDMDKEEIVACQMEFAQTVLEEVSDKEENPFDTFVLVQCGGNQFRNPPDGVFPNVVEATGYNSDVARMIADTIFDVKA